MATLFELSEEISKKTGVETEKVKDVLYALGDGIIAAMKRDGLSEYRIHIPYLGIFKIEKLPKKRKPQLVFYPSKAFEKYKIQELTGGKQ